MPGLGRQAATALAVADRIDRVTTKTGDDGKTSLADGQRYPKQHARIELLGCLDEANCAIGAFATRIDAESRHYLLIIQSRLFDVGAAVATGTTGDFWHTETALLEGHTERINDQLEPLKEFVLPGGNEANAMGHLARASVRRVERAFWQADMDVLVEAGVATYLNRLSDYLFVLARSVASEELVWQPVDRD